MAIEIKELIIKLTVAENSSDKKIVTGEINQTMKNRIIKECVDKVLEKIETKIER